MSIPKVAKKIYIFKYIENGLLNKRAETITRIIKYQRYGFKCPGIRWKKHGIQTCSEKYSIPLFINGARATKKTLGN